mgnify:FL=1
MGLKFRCKTCGEDVVVRFLKVGETAECKNCGASNPVPEAAESADDETAASYQSRARRPEGASVDSTRSISTETGDGSQKPTQHGATIITVAAYIVAAWAVLILVAYAAGTATGSLAATIGSAALWAAYALALFKRDARAVGLSWIMVVLLGLGTILGGLVPLMIGIWALLLAFTLYLRKHRDVLRRQSTRSTHDPSAV